MLSLLTIHQRNTNETLKDCFSVSFLFLIASMIDDISTKYPIFNPFYMKGAIILTIILIFSIIIIIAVILLSVLTVNKSYRYQHTIDPEPTNNEENHSESNSYPKE